MNAPLGMLKVLSVADLVETQAAEWFPFVHHATRRVVGWVAAQDAPSSAAGARGTADWMMGLAGLKATYISLACTRTGRKFVLMHD